MWMIFVNVVAVVRIYLFNFSARQRQVVSQLSQYKENLELFKFKFNLMINILRLISSPSQVMKIYRIIFRSYRSSFCFLMRCVACVYDEFHNPISIALY